MDQMELSAIEGNLTLDKERKIWCVKLPYRVDPKILQDNRYQVICILESQEMRLKGDPELIKAYNKQIDDFLARGLSKSCLMNT